MRAFVAVTNPEWYRFLSDPTRSEIPVVNFWKPGGGSFRALNDGEYFVFKAKAPINRVVGGGRYRGYVTMPVSYAWAQFGEANGAASLAELRRLIGGDKPIAPDDDPVIGCILVSDVTFVPVDLSFDLPPGWARSGIQQGKTYDMAGYDVADYFADIMHIIPDEDATAEAGEPWEASGPMYGNPTLTKYRLRQNVFHAVVLNAYRGRCAITGSRIRPALQSAHIRPVASGGKNRLDNGLLLRSDVHAMFDGGYLGVDPAYRLRVSPRLRGEFGNGGSRHLDRRALAEGRGGLRLMDRRPLAGWACACACSLSAGRQQLKQFRRRSSGCAVLVRLVIAAGSGPPFPPAALPRQPGDSPERVCVWL